MTYRMVTILFFLLKLGVCLVVQLRVVNCETASGTENNLNLRTGLFESLQGCETGIYIREEGFKYIQVKSQTECGMHCLSNSECMSFGVSTSYLVDTDGRLVTEQFCTLFNTAAVTCDAIVYEPTWMYKRMTQFHGSDDRVNRIASKIGSTSSPTETTVGPETSECTYKQSCDIPNDALKCGSWQFVYESFSGDHSGSLSCLIRALSNGASVRISVKLADNLFHRLTPIRYVLMESSPEDIIFFHHAPRFYVEYDNETNAYKTYKEYIGISTAGHLYSSVFDAATNTLKRGTPENHVTAQYFIRSTNCEATSSPTYYTIDGDNNGDRYLKQLIESQSKGAVLTIQSIVGKILKSVSDRWSISNARNNTLGVMTFGNEVFAQNNPLEILAPLVTEYQMLTTNGLIQILELDTTNSVSRRAISVDTQAWFIDSCWVPVYHVYDNGVEDTNYDFKYFKNAMLGGAKIRVCYFTSGTDHCASVPTTTCYDGDSVCILHLEIHPDLGKDTQFQFKFESQNYLISYVSDLVLTTLTKTQVRDPNINEDIDVSPVTVYADSLIYSVVLVEVSGTIIYDDLVMVGKEGSNIKMAIFIDDVEMIFVDVEELVGVSSSNNQEMHSAIHSIQNPGVNDCRGQGVISRRFVLTTRPFTLKQFTWSLDFTRQCKMNEKVSHKNLTVLASTGLPSMSTI